MATNKPISELDASAPPNKKIKVEKTESETFTCNLCSQNFTRKFNLVRHVKKCQTNQNDIKKWKCFKCELSFFKASFLKEHLRNAHDIIIQSTKLQFSTYEEFLEWKELEEERTYSYFPKSCFKNNNDKGIYERFTCQFHGTKRSHHKKDYIKKNVRKLSKGSCKNNEVCFAAIVVRANDEGNIEVDYTDTHCHDLSVENIKYQRMPKSVYKSAVEMLSMGLTPKMVHSRLAGNSLHEESDKTCTRKDFVKLKNILNIQQKIRSQNKSEVRSSNRKKKVKVNHATEDQKVIPVPVNEINTSLNEIAEEQTPKCEKTNEISDLLVIEQAAEDDFISDAIEHPKFECEEMVEIDDSCAIVLIQEDDQLLEPKEEIIDESQRKRINKYLNQLKHLNNSKKLNQEYSQWLENILEEFVTQYNQLKENFNDFT